MLDTSAGMSQNFAPIHGFTRESVSPCFVSGDLSRQMLTHHFEFPLTEDFIQCAIYDTNSSNGKLLGVGYALSDKIFATLPAEEKKLWHSLAWLAKSGMCLIPMSTMGLEHAAMEKMSHFYAKTFHFWKIDKGHNLPMGAPELMMAFTSEDQIKQEIIDARLSISKTSIIDSKKDKVDITMPFIDDNADSWKTGKAMQIKPVMADSGPWVDFTLTAQHVQGMLIKKLAPKPVPGDELSLKDSLLNTGSSILQTFSPMKNICNHIYGGHFYNGDMHRQVDAHHFCSHLTEDMRQCLIFDSASKNAKLMGVEYMISEKLFKTLPEEEKVYWHSHIWEVKSGVLVCPQLPDTAEHEVMKDAIKTYGKTIQTWHIDQDVLPMGVPQLLMSFTGDNQVHPDMFKVRDQMVWKTGYLQSRAQRKDIEAPVRDPAADQWMMNKVVQFKAEEVSMKL
jgi:hypothetical protein